MARNSLLRCQGTAHVVTAVLPTLLHESGLVLQNGECLLQAVDLCLTAFLTFLISLRLGDAAVFQFAVIFHHSRELRAQGVLVARPLRNALVERGEFLGLVLLILVLVGLQDLVLLRQGSICLLIVSLLRLDLGKICCKVGFYNFKNANNAVASSLCGLMLCWSSRLLYESSASLGIIITKDIKGLPHATKAFFQIGLGHKVDSMCVLMPLFVCSLFLLRSGKFLLKHLNLLLELSRLRGSTVDLVRQFGDILVELALLKLRFCHLII